MKAFIVAGDALQARPLKEYNKPSCTGGVNFRKCPSQQNDFKNIFLGQSDEPLDEIFNKSGLAGFGYISANIDPLSGKKNSDGVRSDWVVRFHPKLVESGKELFRVIDSSDWNQFETGLILGYAQVDVYAWSLGTSDAKKILP